jgi:cell division protein FtsL
LSQEKKASELNRHLKMELLAVTQKSYVEFVAEERLGLKKPKEEEVLVLR